MRSRVLALVRQQPIALLALFVALGGTSFAATRTAGRASAEVIQGCVGNNTGRLRIVNSAARCGTLETPISFNREGRQGPQGDIGKRGAAGRDGATGAAGHDGATGLTGAAGQDGATGATGAAGHDGATGATGADGHDGAPGAAGHDGAAGTNGTNGTDGQSVVATTEPAGANCASGGVKYVSASGTNYVCNGASGASETAAATLTKVETVDGSGSGLDADLLDGRDSSSFVATSAFSSLFTTALGQKFFSGTRSTESNGSGGNGADWLASVYLTAANFPPPGTAFAAGQLLPISQNQALFSLLGTTYGGNGTTSFALPDLRDEAPNGTQYVIVVNGIYPSRP